MPVTPRLHLEIPTGSLRLEGGEGLLVSTMRLGLAQAPGAPPLLLGPTAQAMRRAAGGSTPRERHEPCTP
eukprot:4587021-Pyramimonas_sp.AAC.1